MNPAQIPMRQVGPITINGRHFEQEEAIMAPLATYESPLWPSVSRGAKVSRLCGGINAVVEKHTMSRSIVLEAPDLASAIDIAQDLKTRFDAIAKCISTNSRFARLESFDTKVHASLLYVRISIFPGDASGHNMVTSASEMVLNWILKTYPNLQYSSISANMCVDKKVSAINAILGRGCHTHAEILINRDVCQKILKTTPEKVVRLHQHKNLIGSHLAGSLMSNNAHFANMLLAIYLATGQDAANIVEGSQGMTHAEVKGDQLYFSVHLPNIIVGTVGNGKDLPFVEENLASLGCKAQRAPGENAERLAMIVASLVLCGELSLMAAQTNPGELMRSHLLMERKQQKA